MTDKATAVADVDAHAVMVRVCPQWSAQSTARKAVQLEPDVLLHAGPAFSEPAAIRRPMLNAACVAAVYEGLAADFSKAESAILAGAIRLAPAQDYGVLTPLANIVSASMALHAVEDRADASRRFYSPLNGGNAVPLHVGLCSNRTLEHMHWVNGELAEQIAEVFQPPVDLLKIARSALAAGDDLHGRTIAATGLITEPWQDDLEAKPVLADFFAHCPSFFLNLWMAACRCMLSATVGVTNSSIISTAGGNGTDFGLQLAGLPGVWFTGPAAAPHADLEGQLMARRLGAVGDSAVVDVAGFGAMAMRYSEPQTQAMRNIAPDDVMERPGALLLGRHPGFDSLQVLTGMSASRAVARQLSPMISLGILDVKGELGRVGGGLYQCPMDIVAEAVQALDGGAP